MAVTLINPFEVPGGRDEECLRLWDEVAAYMRAQPGFVSTRLHRSLRPEAHFRFVNIAEWESAEHFQRAISTEEFRRLAEAMQNFPHHPTLYELVRT